MQWQVIRVILKLQLTSEQFDWLNLSELLEGIMSDVEEENEFDDGHGSSDEEDEGVEVPQVHRVQHLFVFLTKDR